MLHAREEGSGRPLVLVHGAGTSHEIWRRVVPLLSQSRRVVAPDLPGYGQSPPAGGGFELAVVADRLAAGLALRGLTEPFDLVGHSLGGALCLLLAARHPAAVARLILVAPAGLAAAHPAAGLLLKRTAGPLARVRRTLGVPVAGLTIARRVSLATMVLDARRVPAEDARALLRASAGARRIGPGLAAAATADLRGLLDREGVEAPVGLIWGDRDPIVPLSQMAVVLIRRPGTPLRVIPDAAHAPMIEHPEAFVEALGELLEILVASKPKIDNPRSRVA